MTRRSLVAGIAGIAALSSLAALLRTSVPEHGSPTAAHPPAAPTAANAPATAPAIAGTLGSIYALTSTTRVELGGEARAYDIALDAALSLTEVERAADGSRIVQLALSRVRVTDATTGGMRAPDASSGLEVPMYLSLEARGRIAALYIAPATKPHERNALRAIAYSTQRIAAPGSADTWTETETLYGEPASARYRRLAPRTIEKTVTSDAPTGARHVATTRFELDRDDILVTARRDERGEDPTLGMASHSSLTLRRVGTRPGESARLAWIRDRDRLQTSAGGPEIDAETIRRQAYAELDDGTSLADLMTMLAHAPADDDGRARNYLQHRLVARLALHPDRARALSDAIRSPATATGARVALGALAAVDHDATERALIELALDPALDHELAADAADALTQHETPSDAAVAALRELADDREDLRRKTAALGLGTLAHALANERRGESLVEDLIARFAAARTEAERLLYLGALGNTGSARVLPVIEQVLAGGSPRLREQATACLRLIDAPRAVELLGQLLTVDTDVQVRIAAVFAARFRPLAPLMPALDQVLRADRVAEVRRAAVELLAGARAEVPAARALLGWVAERDPSPELRARARQLLG